MASYITKVKSSGNDTTYNLYDTTAVRGVTLNGIPGDKDPDGIVSLQTNVYSKAAKTSLGLVKVPTLINEDLENDIALGDNGELFVKFPIKKVKIGGFEKSINNQTLEIPKAAIDTYGAIRLSSNNDYCIKIDANGYLYTMFSNEYTDVAKEDEEIDFENLVSSGVISLEE